VNISLPLGSDQAGTKITQLNVLLLRAKQLQVNTSSVEHLIALAQEAMDAGDYTVALAYMEKAESELRRLIDAKQTRQAGNFDSLLLGVVAALALAGGYYYFFVRERRH